MLDRRPTNQQTCRHIELLFATKNMHRKHEYYHFSVDKILPFFTQLFVYPVYQTIVIPKVGVLEDQGPEFDIKLEMEEKQNMQPCHQKINFALAEEILYYLQKETYHTEQKNQNM